jgi:pimeloyl-ACP methyl ester carboxylesterase
MTFSVDGCEISYDVAGRGSPIVLVHGLGGSKTIWRRLRDELADRFTVVTYDLRGSGETTESPPGRELSLTVWSDDLRALLTGLGLGPVALVGHSLGASISIKYTLRWPGDVSALVLMGADPDLSRLAPRMQRTVDLIGEVGLPEWVDRYWSTNTPFSATSLDRTPEILAEYRAMVLANDPENYTRTCRAIMSTEDLTGELPIVTQPALVISGSADDRTLPEAGRELSEKLGDGRFIELPDVGHTMPLEAPAEVASAVKAFLPIDAGGGAAAVGHAV